MATASHPKDPSFAIGASLLVRVLALAHAAAFGSFWVQAAGLIGSRGILPAGQFFKLAREQLGVRAYYDLPSLCWVFGTGRFIDLLCLFGLLASLLLFLGRAQATCLGILWVAYLSLCSAGQIFFDYQWDALLLESTLLALFLVPWTLGRSDSRYDPPALSRYVTWWLLFRLMFLSGIAKLASSDPTWRNLTALVYHYETQPLPSPLAWYAHQLPLWFQKFCCGAMFALELLAPLCLAGPRLMRHAAALGLLGLQVVIAATGSFAFFNLLSAGLCLICLDDGFWKGLHWGVSEGAPGPSSSSPALVRLRPTFTRWFAAMAVGITFFESVAALSPRAARSPLVSIVAESVGPFRSFNDYGLFAVMTVERPELCVEGSDDGREWKDYNPRYKPGELSRRPRWVAPHQPRLDWQLWFAALESPADNVWVETLCERLLRGEPAVVDLFRNNPFPDHAPRYMRVVRYRYEFTGFDEKSRSGNWWRRTPIGFYVNPVQLPPETR